MKKRSTRKFKILISDVQENRGAVQRSTFIKRKLNTGFTHTPISLWFCFCRKVRGGAHYIIQMLSLNEYWKGRTKAKVIKVSGFTLVEMIVSIGLFVTVAVISTGAFITILNAEDKIQATRFAMDNLTITIEDMVREMKTGTLYTCVQGSFPSDCTDGSSVTVQSRSGDEVTYALSGSKINKTTPSGTLAITGDDVVVNSFKVIVGGNIVDDDIQPYIIIAIDVELTERHQKSKFRIQTMITQRKLDL